MLTLPPAAQVHLERESRFLTICGVIEKRDGTFVRCTQSDEDLEIEAGDFAGVYLSINAVDGSDIRSSSDLSVDNMEIRGPLSDSIQFAGFTVADIEAGLFDNAPFQTFLCQTDDPGAWQKSLRRGYLGDIRRTAEGQFEAEWRGILQALQQAIGATYSELCDVKRFGDQRCGLTANVRTATVTAVTSRRRFDVLIAGGATLAGFFDLGEIDFTSGANAGYLRQIKRDAVGAVVGHLELWESYPRDVQIGDTLTLREGCDRRFETCQAKDNVVNFRGHGRWIPGIPSIIRAPG